MNKKVIVTNLMVAMLAQVVSLVLSFLISFIVPKILDIEAFSFWQLFIFYISYVGFFHFGINDGVYLKYGGQNLDEMNKGLVSGQFKYLFVLQLIVILFMGICISIVDMGSHRRLVLYYVLAYMLVFNLSNYLGFIFQAANLTKWYSYSVLIDKMFFMVSVVVLLITNEQNFPIYIYLYLCGKALCLIFCLWKGRQLVFCRASNYKKLIPEIKNTMNIGIKLTLSSMSSMLIIGIGRFFIDSHWGITVFGKVSFALSLTYFVLAFVQQISMVFFPMLRRVNDEKQKYVYLFMYRFCFFIMPLIYIFMVPGKMLIAAWIPKYIDSVYYLTIMLPICIFDAKMNLIFNTYLKVLRKENLLLRINFLTLIVSCVLCVICTFILNSYWLVILSMVVAIAFRSILSESILNKLLDLKSLKLILYEIFFALSYIVISLLSEGVLINFAALFLLFGLQLVFFRNEFQKFINTSQLFFHKGAFNN